MNCILCGDQNLHRLATIRRVDLLALYRKRYKIDIAHLVPTDLSLLKCGTCELAFFDPPATGDQEFYEKLQKYEWYYEEQKPEFEWAKSRITAGASVLEVGAGGGGFASQIPANNYTGLDFSVSAKNLAASRGISIHTKSIEEWAEEDLGRYDFVCHFQVLEHVSQPGPFLRACAKALKTGGCMLVSVPSQDSFLNLATNNALNLPPHHTSRWTDGALAAAGPLMGCAVDEIVHDAVAPQHRAWMVSEVLRNHWFGQSPMIDLGIGLKLKMAMIRHLSHALGLDTIEQRFLGIGHTVNIAYCKL